MSESAIVLITLVVYKVVLIGIGFWASRRMQSTDDFFLGGRQLGATVAAISASASSSSAWTLLGVSGAAYLWGYSAIWLLPSVLLGFLFNWLWLAPRMFKQSRAINAVTVTDMLVPEPKHPLAMTIRRAAIMIIVFSFTFYIAAQFKAAGTSFESVFELDFTQAIILGAAIILIYTLLGGFWAVSVTDTLQGLLMALTAVLLPVIAMIEVGGLSGLTDSLASQSQALPSHYTDFTGEHFGIAAMGFVIGILGIGNGYPGQPHVVNRFMAIKDEAALKRGRVIALGWALLVYCGMLLVGWSARVILPIADNNEAIFFSLAQTLLSPVLAGIMIAAVLSAVMSTADSQILVVSSAISYDATPGRAHSVMAGRLAVFGVCALAVLLAVYLDQSIFDRVLFAWHAIGSSFGPVLIIRLLGRQISSMGTLLAMLFGFGLTIIINSYPNLPGDVAERWVPFVLALTIAWLNSVRTSDSK